MSTQTDSTRGIPLGGSPGEVSRGEDTEEETGRSEGREGILDGQVRRTDV